MFLRVVIGGLCLDNSAVGPISFVEEPTFIRAAKHSGKPMPEFKLISADSHVNEPPAAWERVQKEYGERAPKVVKDPPGVPRGIWLLIDGLPPVGLSHYSKGQAVGKDKGISEVEQEKHFETIRFNEQFRYEDYPGGWEPEARLKDQDIDGIEAEVLFSSPTRQLYSIIDEPFQRAVFNSYNEWLHKFCGYNPKRLIGLATLSILRSEERRVGKN